MRELIQKIRTRTLQKWEKSLAEMNAKSSGRLFSNVNSALHQVKDELYRREVQREQASNLRRRSN